jgi:hypothetical protein
MISNEEFLSMLGDLDEKNSTKPKRVRSNQPVVKVDVVSVIAWISLFGSIFMLSIGAVSSVFWATMLILLSIGVIILSSVN